MTLAELGRAQEAAQAYRAILRDSPANTTALNNLADLLASTTEPGLLDGFEAVKLATTACALTGYQNPTFLATLAEAQAATGQLHDAIATAEQARRLALQDHQPGLADTIAVRIQYFQAALHR